MAMRAGSLYRTADDLDDRPDDGNRYEIIDGVVLVTPPPSLGHQRILRELFLRLHSFASARGLEVLFAPVDVRASPVTQVEPDLLVLPRHFEGSEHVRWAPMSALVLAVEILSPSTAHVDRGRKRELYLAEGIPEYWIVDGSSRWVEVWRPGAADAQRVRDTLVWTPPGATESLDVDLVALFDDAR